MAKATIKEKVEASTEEKLKNLYTLQLIDSKIDRIRIIRGELPLEVQDLEDVVAGLETRLANFTEEVTELDKQINEKKNAISIPINTVQTDDKGKFVFIAVNENGKLVARKKAVTVGEFYGNNIEILSGVTAGELIIKEGYQSLYDGQNITTGTK